MYVVKYLTSHLGSYRLCLLVHQMYDLPLELLVIQRCTGWECFLHMPQLVSPQYVLAFDQSCDTKIIFM